jgi:hypothetical protein
MKPFEVKDSWAEAWGQECVHILCEVDDMLDILEKECLLIKIQESDEWLDKIRSMVKAFLDDAREQNK